MKKKILFISGILLLILSGFFISKKLNVNPWYSVGQELDNFNGVSVYYNGAVGHIDGRAVTADGYNLGLKYQCVEFVKRYYYEQLNHKMPDSYGHAKDFFNPAIRDGQHNTQRDLIQYTNPSKVKPKVNDLIIYSSTTLNRFGHVAIISEVTEDTIEIIQQNPGPFGSSREEYNIVRQNNVWQIQSTRILGWLRKE